MKITSKKKIYLIGLPILAVFVLFGVLICKSTSAASSNSLTPERIYEIHKEYIESTYGPGTGFKIDLYGGSATGKIKWSVTDDER